MDKKKKRKIWDKKYRENHKEQIRILAKIYPKKLGLTRQEFLLALAKLHNKDTKCYRCGIADWRILQVDHLKGMGRTERLRIGKNTLNYRRNILKHPEKYQILCANCNWIKRYERNEHTKNQGVPERD